MASHEEASLKALLARGRRSIRGENRLSNEEIQIQGEN